MHWLKRLIFCTIIQLIAVNCMATNGTITLNSSMPAKPVSVIATECVDLKPGFSSAATGGTFSAKIGSINSVYPSVPVESGSATPLAPLPNESVGLTGFETQTMVPRVEMTDASLINSSNSLVQVECIDGLGRPNMMVTKKITPSGKDLVSMINYDCNSKVYQEWLPTPMNSATLHDPGLVIQESKNTYADAMPYSSTSLPTDVLFGETTSSMAYCRPGVEWHNGNKVQTEFRSSEYIKEYKAEGDDVVLTSNVINSVRYRKVVNEDGQEKYIYFDMDDRTLLVRMVDGGINHDTYYVYNDLGLLCFILSPEATDRMSTIDRYTLEGVNTDGNPLAQYAFAYRYDDMGRCVEKKLPGKDWQFFVYDQAGRLAFSQEANQRGRNEWTFYKYDNHNRPIQSGTVTSESSRASIQTAYNNRTVVESFQTNPVTGYTSSSMVNSPFSNSVFVLLTQNFYDTYDYLNLPSLASLKATLTYNALNGFGSRFVNQVEGVDIATRGALTGTWVAMLDNPLPAIVTSMYYDTKGRVVQVLSNNHLSGYEKNYLSYNFTGQLLVSRHIHKAYSNAEIREDYSLTYDGVGRPVTVKHAINGGTAIVMDELQYDELGRAKTKKLHGGIQTVNYAYNIQGWLKSITSPQFSENLLYQESQLDNTPCFNGNISAAKWGAGGTLDKQYSFTYDKINRLNSAVYAPDGNFSEEIGEYDKNGNILFLTRKGKVFNETTSITATDNIDDLAYSYAGNQLKAVTDHSTKEDAHPIANNDFQDPEGANPTVEYQYDPNGNLQSDFNKGVFLTEYNLLNLPAKMQFRLGHKIRYSYDAEGVKRRAEYSTVQCPTQIPLSTTAFVDTFTIQSTTTSDYCGNFIYENGILQRILTPEGYLQTNGSSSVQTWRYVYFLRDHLGNTRAQLLSSPLSNPTSTAYTAGAVTDYYPFGMQITPASGLPSNTNPYLYGGKELDRMHGLNEADFMARWLDNTVPGFTSPDPLLERHPWESPYLYCGNNPVNRIDPTGLDWCTNYSAPTHDQMHWLSENEEALGKLDNYTYHYKVCYMVEGDYTYFFDGEGYTHITLPAVDVTPSTSSSNSMASFGSGFSIAPDRSGGGDESSGQGGEKQTGPKYFTENGALLFNSNEINLKNEVRVVSNSNLAAFKKSLDISNWADRMNALTNHSGKMNLRIGINGETFMVKPRDINFWILEIFDTGSSIFNDVNKNKQLPSRIPSSIYDEYIYGTPVNW